MTEESTLPPVHPLLDPVDGLGKLLSELRSLRAQRRREPGAEGEEDGEEAQHDDRRTRATRNAQPLESVHPGRDGDREQHAEEGDEEQRVGEPDQPEHQVHRQDEPRGSHDVAAAPPHLPPMPCVAATMCRW